MSWITPSVPIFADAFALGFDSRGAFLTLEPQEQYHHNAALQLHGGFYHRLSLPLYGLDGNHKTRIVLEGLLRFIDQQRRSNFCFFDGCSGGSAKVEMAFIPLENLGTLELVDRRATSGKQIYVAGECQRNSSGKIDG